MRMNKAFLKDLFVRDPGCPQAPLPISLSSRAQTWAVGLVCALLLAPLYLWTAAPSLGLSHDTGELTTCCIIQGVPHSPGYPLFVALGWLVCQLPFQLEPAYMLNLLAAVEVALAMGFLGAALTLASRPGPALVATLLTGSCTAIWRQAVATEVFSLHLLFLCMLLWLAALWEQSEDKKRREILLITSFLLGCSLAHQHIMALAAPPLIAFGVASKGRGRAWGFSWPALPLFLAAFILPYMLQMYCAQQSPALNWEDPSTIPKMIDHFLRKSYGTGLLNLAALKYDSRAGDAQVNSYMISLLRSYYPFPSFVLALLCLDRVGVSGLNPRIGLYIGLAAIYGPLFASLGNQPTEEFYADMMERFYSCSMVGVTGMLAFGIDWTFFHLLPKKSTRYLPALLLLVLYNTASNYPKCSQRNNYLAVDLLRASFRQLPPHSALLIGGDLPSGAVDYLHYGLGEFRNVLVVLPGLTSGEFYRARLPVRLNLAATRGKKDGEFVTNEEAIRNIVDDLESRGMEIYCNQVPPGLKGDYTRIGLLMRFRGKGPVWSPKKVQSECVRVYNVLKEIPLRGPQKKDWRQNFWTRFCLSEWLVAYRELAKGMVEVDKNRALKAMDHVIALESTPHPDSYLNRAGLLLELKQYREAINDYEICLKLAPTSRLALQGIMTAHAALGENDAAVRYQRRLESL